MRAALLCLLLGLTALPASAKPAVVAMPLQSHVLLLPVPDGFEVAPQPMPVILVLVPRGERMERATRSLMVSAEPRHPDPAAYLKKMALWARNDCPPFFSSLDLPPPRVKGATAGVAAWFSCGSQRGWASYEVWMVLDTGTETVALSWGEEVRNPPGLLAPDMDKIRAAVALMEKARICLKAPDSPAEAPTCAR